MLKKTLTSHNVKESEKTFLDLSLYLDPHQKLMGSNLGLDSSSIQVSSKSRPQTTNQPTDKQVDTGDNISSLVEIINNLYPKRRRYQIWILLICPDDGPCHQTADDVKTCDLKIPSSITFWLKHKLMTEGAYEPLSSHLCSTAGIGREVRIRYHHFLEWRTSTSDHT